MYFVPQQIRFSNQPIEQDQVMQQRTQRTISIRKQILGRLKLNQIQGNPICPVNKAYKLKQAKTSKRIPTIEEQIFSTQSRKLIKPYNTQKLITLESSDYSICSVLKSPSYQKLQNKLRSMMQNFSKEKKQLAKDIRKLDSEIQQQTEKSSDLCRKLMRLDDNYDRMENQYYERKRENYQLRAQLDQRRERLGTWRFDFARREPSETSQIVDLDQMTYEDILLMEERLGKHNIGMTKEKMDKLQVKKFKDLFNSEKRDVQEEKQQGKEKAQIKKFSESSDMNCCICCETIDEEANVIELHCQHIHHAICLKQWLKIKKFCPLCKGQVTIN